MPKKKASSNNGQSSFQDEIGHLKRKQASITANLTRFSTFIDGIKSRDVKDSKLALELETRLNNIETHLLQDFQQLDFDLSASDPDYISELTSFETEYYSLVSEAKSFIQRIGYETAQATFQLHHPNIQVHNRPQAVNLPKIQIAKFSGLHEQWGQFKDLFTSLIHNNKSISDVEKFYYLRTYLEGSAAQCIKLLDTTEQNYKTAWDILCKRFDNKNLMVHKHIKLLFNINEVKQESPGTLRHIVDSLAENLNCLQNLGIETKSWDPLIIFLVTSKLDTEALREWEQFKLQGDLPTLDELKTCLLNRANFLEKLNTHKDKSRANPPQPNNHSNMLGQKRFTGSTVVNDSRRNAFSCYLCQNQHSIYNCPEFLSLTIPQRRDKVYDLNLCFNCLQRGHSVKECKRGSCKRCAGFHNSLLHPDSGATARSTKHSRSNTFVSSANHSTSNKHSPDNSNNSLNPQLNDAVQSTSTLTFCNYASSGQVLLATALVKVTDAQGTEHHCRALLDNGSMSNFISRDMADILGARQNPIDFDVLGVGNSHSTIKSACDINIKSFHSDFQAKLHCLVIPEITNSLPISSINPKFIQVPAGINLADPQFFQPRKVQLLIGADTFWRILSNQTISLGKNMPTMQDTALGWIISGPVPASKPKFSLCHFSKALEVQEQLSKFWEIEEVSNTPLPSNEEALAESHFSSTFSKNSDGRFIVSIPLKEPVSVLGDSQESAKRQFFALERRLSANHTLREMYVAFMTEYLNLNHMTPFSPSEGQVTYFSPHHGVLRLDHETTKLRVVFNSSSASTTGHSYNSIQMTGPVVQEDLFSILIRFRQHIYVFNADICKMYRQILVKDEFKPLQLIFWRDNPDAKLETFSLNTVTYGTRSASYLATRCIKQLAIENEEHFPKAAQVLHRDFYVDDVLSGGDSADEVIDTCNQISMILNSAGFELRKWKSNDKNILVGIAKSTTDIFHFSPSETGKILGMFWCSQQDYFSFDLQPLGNVKTVTKRTILSEIARIFDPLGLLSPIVVVAKLLLQALWAEKLSWDQEIPGHLSKAWLLYREKLLQLNSLQIPRLISIKNRQVIEMHGFCDASQKAYGACIYIRALDSHGNTRVNLLASKSRVASIKSLTIPRLELSGALLLAKLVKLVSTSLSLNIDKYFLWSDSTITLAWIRTPPNLLQPFVSHRVSDIQSLTEIHSWRYVPTDSNPADSLSRGAYPSSLLTSKTWFSGPSWLHSSEEHWPPDISLYSPTPLDQLPEIRQQTKCFAHFNDGKWINYDNYSSFSQIKRVFAYMLRFIHNIRNNKNPQLQRKGCLTSIDMQESFELLVKKVQQESYPSEIYDLTKSGVVSNKSKLLSLTPFLSNGLIRVGGRLKHSSYPFQKKHPVVLPHDHRLTYLIFRYEHFHLLHCGPNQLLAQTREYCWVTLGKNLAKRIVRECVVCHRFKPNRLLPIMGNLPGPRVSPNLPFTDTGVDYAGPFSIKNRKGRGCRLQKSYLCLFICLSTKAVHLELVTELTTSAFLECFQRFIARRGRPSHVYSDNGTNFVGARNYLNELGDFLKTSEASLTSNIESSFSVQWHFIAAYSPHHGGLWEAGVKSAKHHIKRVLLNSKLTFDGFYTVLTQIESILNSRPLTALSTDPNDLEALTPGHFLIGRSLQSIPFPNVQTVPVNRLSYFEQLEQLKQHFWSRWSKEYIAQLQQRVKWKTNKCQIEVGALVLIRDDNLPPSNWKLGRIVALHPGSDRVVRVVSVKTASGIIKRAVAKICPLPIAT